VGPAHVRADLGEDALGGPLVLGVYPTFETYAVADASIAPSLHPEGFGRAVVETQPLASR